MPAIEPRIRQASCALLEDFAASPPAALYSSFRKELDGREPAP